MNPTTPLWAEGPTLSHLTDEDGTYWVNPEWRDRYLTKAEALAKNPRRITDAMNIPHRSMFAVEYRNRARARHNQPPINDAADTRTGWPSDSIGLAGTLLHFQLLDELATEDWQAEQDTLSAQYVPSCGACAARVPLSGSLCADCTEALAFIKWQQAEAKAADQLKGRPAKTRGEAVSAWLAS